MAPRLTKSSRYVARVLRALAILGSLATAACAQPTNDDLGGDSTTSITASPGQQDTSVGEAVDLRPVCPNPLVVQTDWYPQAEHGGVYELLGEEYVVDAARGATRGPLTVNGSSTGIDIEIRAGGPFLESPVVTEMFLDPSIMFGYVGTDVALSRHAQTPTLAVFNALAINPQVILWNADKHPDATTIADIAQVVPEVSVFGDRPYMRFLVQEGHVQAEKVDTNYKGNLRLATDDVAHQGFVTSEPHRYAVLESGSVRTAYQLIHDAGWTSYPQNLAVNALRVDELRDCLVAVIPLLQQAQIDFITTPRRTIDTIIDVVQQLDTTWSQTLALATYATETMTQLRIVQNGDTATFGDFESPRLDDFIARAIPILREQGIDVPDLSPGDIATNEFLNPAITLP